MLTRRALITLSVEAGSLALLGFSGCTVAPTENGSLKYVRYSSGGGMEGGNESSELSRAKDGTVSLVVSSKEWHNARATTDTYELDESAFDAFVQIAEEYDLARAAKRKESELIALDAPTSSISYGYVGSDGLLDYDQSFTVSSTQDLSDKEREGCRAVMNALAELASTHEGVHTQEPISFTLSAKGYPYTFVSNDSPAVEDLAERMPLSIKLEDHSDNEKTFHLDESLDVSDTPLATGAAGTLCYDAPSNDVVIFCADVAPADGLYELGRIGEDYSIESLAKIEPGDYTMWSNA